MKFKKLDPMFAAPARVAILATLADGRPWLFADLRAETGLADGNLHVQTRKLQDAGYVSVEKVNPGGRRVTCFQLTEAGLAALVAYGDLLGQAIRQQNQASGMAHNKPSVRKDDGGRVW